MGKVILEKIYREAHYEVVFSSSHPGTSRQLGDLVSKGILRKIAPKVYTYNLQDDPTEIIRRNLFSILGYLYPGCVISHRSALEYRPTPEGYFFITYTYTKKVKYPGLTLSIQEGPAALEGDSQMGPTLWASQEARAMLENLTITKRKGGQSKALPLSKLEERLEEIVRVRGEDALNALRDKAREIAPALGLQQAFERLHTLIGALLSTRPVGKLTSPLAIARALRNPYDPARWQLFEKLSVALRQSVFPARPEPRFVEDSWRSFALFEAYFSNYIEGTKFPWEVALQIMQSGISMPTRNEDSHDVIGTFSLVSSREEMRIVPNTGEELLSLLLYRHGVLMRARPQCMPGEFKRENNRAGNTHFVDHSLVKGTLLKGFELMRGLDDAFARAAYMMFMISEVHPFTDGNGRIARIMMNAELASLGQTRIIIPTVFREDYILALKALTKREEPQPYLRMLQRAQEFSAIIQGPDVGKIKRVLEACNAFAEPSDAKLRIPSEP